MTLDELKAISDACATDAEFLAHPEVRRAYWKALGDEGPWKHALLFFGVNDEPVAWRCLKCETVYEAEIERTTSTLAGFGLCYSKEKVCSIPCPIPCSLPDAVERLREKVAENESTSAGAWEAIFALHELACGGGGSVDSILASAYLVNDARDRFLVFAAARGAVEMAEVTKETP